MYKRLPLLCVLLSVLFVQSCTQPETEVIDKIIEKFQYGDSTAITINPEDGEYIMGKCVMLSFERQDYSIPYSQLNVDTAFADADWITLTRHSTYVTVTITENYTVEYRNCHAYYKLKGTEKFDTVTVSQGPKDTFFVESSMGSYDLDYNMHEVYFNVFSNVEYTIEIPDSAQEWIQQLSPIKTRSIFKDSQFGIKVQANDGDFREAYISIKSKKSKEHQLIRIAQDKKYYTLDRAIAANPDLSIFSQAIISTGLKDTLEIYKDYTYPTIPYEWTEQALRDNYSGIHMNETAYETGSNADRIAIPEVREFKYTVFCMPDAALAEYSDEYTAKAGLNGIHNLDDLRSYAKQVYDPAGTGPTDETDRNNSLNKFISYHILPFWLSYDQFNTRQKAIIMRRLFLDELDVEDFYETLLPHSIMRISTPYSDRTWEIPMGIYINRRGTIKTGLITEGIRIAQNESEYNLKGELSNTCVNGGYHYINKLLAYDTFTREVALQCRMRIMCCTLSPDFINSGGRGRLNGDPINGGITNINKMVMSYKEGFCRNFMWVEGQTRFFVRYRDASFGTYYGDQVDVRGDYDLAFKLPAVPTDGTYEIRVWNNSLASSGRGDRGIVQFFLHQYNPGVDESVYWRSWDWAPKGDPVDLRLGGGDARIGMIVDNDCRYDGMTDSEKEQAINANDRSMRYRGYMKAPDSYTSGTSIDNTGDPICVDENCYRKIVCNEYLKADTYYYIRMRQVYEEDGVFPFSFIEIVPKSVYEGNEDKH